MWDLLFKLGAAVLIGGAAVAAVYVIKGVINKYTIQQTMRDKDIQEAIIENVYRSAKKVKLKDVRRGSSFEITGDKISDKISEGMKIYA